MKELSDEEVELLHELQLATEHIKRANGHLAAFNHETGSALRHMSNAVDILYELEEIENAENLSDLMNEGVIGDQWTFEILENYESQFANPLFGLESDIRDEFADGERHIQEKQVKEKWKTSE